MPSNDELRGRLSLEGVSLKNDIDIQWSCQGSRLIAAAASLPKKMQRSEGQWCMDTFSLEEPLYKGSASLVYVALDKLSLETVVLKLYRKSKLSALNRFQVEREILLHTKLEHEHIIQLVRVWITLSPMQKLLVLMKFAAFEDSNYVYLVQEYAEKGDLFGFVKERAGQMKEEYIVQQLLSPFLSAIQYLHAQGIIHRDIKPENIFVTADEKIKIADFGLSIDEGKERPVTRAGTLDYMAPEVLHCPNKTFPEDNKLNKSLVYNFKVDVWAAGILAYELMTGAPPFENESRSTTYHFIMHREPTFPTEMSEEAQDFIKHALTKNSKKRPAISQLLSHPWMTKRKVEQKISLQATTGPPLPSSTSPDPIIIEKQLAEDAPKEEAESTEVIDTSINSESLSTTSEKGHSSTTMPDTYRTTSTETQIAASQEQESIASLSPPVENYQEASPLKETGFQESPVTRPKLQIKRCQSLFSSDLVDRTPSLPPIQVAKNPVKTSAADDLKNRKPQSSLQLAHTLCSKSEEETTVSPKMLKTVQRMPSYAFFPTNKEGLQHPAHRLNRELTGSQNSFTERLAPIKTSKNKLSFLSRPTKESKEGTVHLKGALKGKKLSFLKFRKNK